MDQLDKKLYNDLNLQMNIPDELDTIIKNALNEKKNGALSFKSNRKIGNKFKVKVASLFVIAFITSGIVLATTGLVHDKKNVWEEPERVVAGDVNRNDIPNETKKNIMSEDEAREKANEILEKFGYQGEEIKEIELQNHVDDYDSSWTVTTEHGIKIIIESNGDDSFSIFPNNVFSEDMKQCRTTMEEAVKTAREIAKKYGYDTKSYENVEVSSNMNSDEESYIYTVTFCKEYDGVKNPYERIQIVFVPQINMLKSFWISNKKCEDNPVKITKEKAEQIALEEERKLSEKYDMYEINKVETEFRIVMMNGEAYLRANEYAQLHDQTYIGYPNEKWVFYRTNSRVRKAWLIRISYKIPDNINRNDGSFNVNDEKFSYFVDATTGEIIGGGSTF